MANQHTQALETRAAELAKEQHAINYEVARLERLIENPICGKPRHGYKAAAKAKKQLAAMQPRVDAFDAAYNEYLYSGKASYKTREQRAAKYYAAFVEWQEVQPDR